MLKNKNFLLIYSLSFVYILIKIYVFPRPVLNYDGIGYLEQAFLFSEGRYKEALNVYNWPAFSFLVGMANKYLNITLITSAKFLNLMSYSILFFYFFKILNIFIKNKPFILLAGLLVYSTSSFDYMNMVIRDHAAWAAFVAGIYFSLMYIDQQKIIDLLLSSLLILISSLFRIEAVVFLIIFPYLILNNRELNFKHILILIFIFLSFMSSLYLLNDYELRIPELLTRPLNILRYFFVSFPLYTDNIQLNELISKNNLDFKFSFLSLVFAKKMLLALGVINLVLAYYSLKKHMFDNKKINFLFFIFFISLLIVYLNLYSTFVLTSRYFGFSYHILIILSAIGLYYLYKNIIDIKTPKVFLFKIFLLVIFSILFLSNIYVKQKDPILDCVKDFKKSGLAHEKLYFSNKKIAYYFGQNFYTPVPLDDESILNFDYLIIDRKMYFPNKAFFDNFVLEKTYNKNKKRYLFVFKIKK